MKNLASLFIVILLLATQANAATISRSDPVVGDIEVYLTNLTTIMADFTQIAPDGSISSGKFYLSRPKNMRWQYDPPTPILMVTNGSYLTYYDFELDQVSDVPLDSTIVGFLTRQPIRFDESVNIEELEKKPGSIRITVSQADRPKDGKLTLEFTDKPIQLRNMVVTDKLNQVTTISLNNARFGVALDEKLFEFQDPRLSRKSRKR